MIKVEKNFIDIPKILKNQLREDAFNQSISTCSDCDDKKLYKVGSVEKRLHEIYHLKCAYCEKKLLDAPKHIEHYRPKNIYYWLAYSWDNLLLSCGSCNSAKGKTFTVANDRVAYSRELFSDIHILGSSYDTIENPQIINPEKEDILHLIGFDKNCIMGSSDTRVQHTIEDICKLNRDELVQNRLEIINDFIQEMNDHYPYFEKYGDITRFIPNIQNFIIKCRVENEFYAFRYFILNNIDIFFDGNKALILIINGVISKIR